MIRPKCGSEENPSTVLFLCTGNYYRSRFAEILFHERASKCQLSWRAVSRGLQLAPEVNFGPISPYALREIERLGLKGDVARFPETVSREDLAAAHLVVAVKEAEHRPLMDRYFPDWAARLEYWQVHDLDCATPEEALPGLAQLVEKLVLRLRETPISRIAG